MAMQPVFAAGGRSRRSQPAVAADVRSRRSQPAAAAKAMDFDAQNLAHTLRAEAKTSRLLPRSSTSCAEPQQPR